MAASRDRFADSVRRFTGISPEIARRVVDTIKLGPVLSLDQLKRQASTFYRLGVIRKDVTGQLDHYFEGELVKSVLGN